MNFLPDSKKNFIKIIFGGILVFALGMFLLGPAPYIFPEYFIFSVLTFCYSDFYIIFIGILIGGAASALINNNAVPAMN